LFIFATSILNFRLVKSSVVAILMNGLYATMTPQSSIAGIITKQPGNEVMRQSKMLLKNKYNKQSLELFTKRKIFLPGPLAKIKDNR
jgi:hypothetical protein